MKFDIYCDESHPDLLSSQNPKVKFMMIGGIWLPFELRDNFKEKIHELRNQFNIGGEFKWRKVTPSREDFYMSLIHWFFSEGNNIRFRCIAVEHEKVNMIKYHNNDQELGFYKFYYQMIHHWIFDYNEYNIFCDFKSNRETDRLNVLRRCLQASNLSSEIVFAQAIRSKESVLLQLVDVLLGSVSAKLNCTHKTGSAKANLIATIEENIGASICPTNKSEQKFNVFKIDLDGGW